MIDQFFCKDVNRSSMIRAATFLNNLVNRKSSYFRAVHWIHDIYWRDLQRHQVGFTFPLFHRSHCIGPDQVNIDFSSNSKEIAYGQDTTNR